MNDCCCTSPAIQAVSVPGVEGAPGAAGTNGVDGASSFTTLTANLVTPEVGQTVTASVGDTSWMVVGMPIFVFGPGNFTVSSISSPVSVILLKSGSPGDVATGATILAGAGVGVGSSQVSAYTNTIADINPIPAVAATVNISVKTTKFMGVGQQLLIGAAGDIFTVTSITSDTIFVGTYADVNTNTHAGNTIALGAKVVVVGLNGVAGYSTTTSATLIPATAGSNVVLPVDVVSSLWMAVGQIVILSETATPALGNFQVVSFPNAQQVVLKWLGYPGDSAPGVSIASGARVSIAGLLQSTSIGTLSVYGAGTAYTLTNTPAAITMGTTSPSLTITAPGTYLLIGQAVFAIAGIDGATALTFTTQINRTNNTPAIVPNSLKTFVAGSGVASKVGQDVDVATPAVIYTTANSTDIIQLWAGDSANPATGTPKISACSIVALRLA